MNIRTLMARTRSALVVAASTGAILVAAPRAYAQNPEERGPLAVADWEAGRIDAGGLQLPTRVFYPEAPGSYPLVGIIHGSNSTGDYHPELASTLASRGMVVVVPDMPCVVWDCDQSQNADAVLALLNWAVTTSETEGMPISGLVDGSRRGLIGHSWGGLTSHLAAARNDGITSLVLLDPNDDVTEGRDATSEIGAATLQLIAENEGACNSMWREAEVRDALDVPNLQATINGSGHCDPGEVDVVCSVACGAGDRDKTALFRRYAVAWTACNLIADPAMGTWLGGAAYTDDVEGAVLENVFAARLDELPCAGEQPDPESDAGPSDAGGDAGGDAVDGDVDVSAEDVGSDDVSNDGGVPDDIDVADDSAALPDSPSVDDSGDDGGSSDDDGAEPPEDTASQPGGCASADAAHGGALWLVVALLGFGRSRRRLGRGERLMRDEGQ